MSNGVSFGLAGRVVVVTGAAQGIGEACVRALVADGAAVALWDVDDVLRPVVEDWRQEDPRWSVLPRWVDNIKQKESQRLCLDIPSRQGKFFQQLLEKDAIYRTGCDPSGFRNIVHGVVSNNNALPPTPSKAKAVTKIWSGDGYILSTEISRHEQTYARPLKTPLPFPSVPRLRIASSVVEEEEMFAPLPDMN